MARRAALLAVALALTVASLPAVHAVTCQSFTSPATCEATTTSSGKCGWRDSVCIPVAPLPPGKVAITSLPTLGTLPALAMEPVAMPAAEDLAAPEEAAGVTPEPSADVAQQSCDDVPTPEGFTCEQQKAWAKCSEPWMIANGWCRRTCGVCGTAQATPVEAVQAAPFCSQPPVTGPCRAAIPSWYFDAASGVCRTFIYGGCQGNENRFSSYKECTTAAESACGATP